MAEPVRTYVALLRGINVGGKTVKMERLRGVLAALGFTAVRTLLASGNALFDAPAQDAAALRSLIEARLAEEFGFTIAVLLWTGSEITNLVRSDPFAGNVVSPATRQYVTFVGDTLTAPPAFPAGFAHDGLRIVRATTSELCIALTLSDGVGTVDLMASLEKVLGKNITTRNWNTVRKIAAAVR